MSAPNEAVRVVAAYEVGAGVLLLGAGVLSGSWWTAAVGALLVASGLFRAFGRGEATSWLRGDLDERRRGAVDSSFRVAFLVLAWWVAALTAIATSHSVPAASWSAGIVLALVAAYISYATTLRRT